MVLISTCLRLSDEYFSEPDAEKEMIIKMASFSHRHFVHLRVFRNRKVPGVQACAEWEQQQILLDRLWGKMCDLHFEVLRNQAYLAKYAQKGFKRGLQRFFTKKWRSRLESLVKADKEIEADLATVDRDINLDNNACRHQHKSLHSAAHRRPRW